MGYDGKGVIIAVVDSGIDYLHPSLGGGFGEGFKVESGWDFVGDNYSTSSPDVLFPDDDPIDCLGHGKCAELDSSTKIPYKPLPCNGCDG